MINFREWLFLEMSHLALPIGFVVGKKRGSFIDMRFETYPAAWQKKLGNWPSFIAQMPNQDKYFVYDGSISKITDSAIMHLIRLPDDWFEYAKIVWSDGSVKESTKGERIPWDQRVAQEKYVG